MAFRLITVRTLRVIGPGLRRGVCRRRRVARRRIINLFRICAFGKEGLCRFLLCRSFLSGGNSLLCIFKGRVSTLGGWRGLTFGGGLRCRLGFRSCSRHCAGLGLYGLYRLSFLLVVVLRLSQRSPYRRRVSLGVSLQLLGFSLGCGYLLARSGFAGTCRTGFATLQGLFSLAAVVRSQHFLQSNVDSKSPRERQVPRGQEGRPQVPKIIHADALKYLRARVLDIRINRNLFYEFKIM